MCNDSDRRFWDLDNRLHVHYVRYWGLLETKGTWFFRFAKWPVGCFGTPEEVGGRIFGNLWKQWLHTYALNIRLWLFGLQLNIMDLCCCAFILYCSHLYREVSLRPYSIVLSNHVYHTTFHYSTICNFIMIYITFEVQDNAHKITQ